MKPEIAAKLIDGVRRRVEVLRLDDLPGVAISRLSFAEGLPRDTVALYFLRGRRGPVLYIGKASNLRQRWWLTLWSGHVSPLSHHMLQRAFDEGDVWLYWWEIPREVLGACEALMVRKYQPIWNTGMFASIDPASKLIRHAREPVERWIRGFTPLRPDPGSCPDDPALQADYWRAVFGMPPSRRARGLPPYWELEFHESDKPRRA